MGLGQRGKTMVNQLWGVIVGGLLGLGGATLTPWLAARRDRTRSRAFVRAYLVSILDIAEARGHDDRAKKGLEAWRSGKGDVRISYFTWLGSFSGYGPSE
jgi:hypothetical protein